jgi:lysozyme
MWNILKMWQFWVGFVVVGAIIFAIRFFMKKREKPKVNNTPTNNEIPTQSVPNDTNSVKQLASYYTDISPDAKQRLKKIEGFSATPYWDEKGWSVGYGHFTGNQKYSVTQEKAEQLLIEDIQKAGKAIAANVVVPITQNQFDSLVHFAFNLGPGYLNPQKNTFIRLINANSSSNEIREWWLKYNKASQKFNQGLYDRRVWESDRFLNDW